MTETEVERERDDSKAAARIWGVVTKHYNHSPAATPIGSAVAEGCQYRIVEDNYAVVPPVLSYGIGLGLEGRDTNLSIYPLSPHVL